MPITDTSKIFRMKKINIIQNYLKYLFYNVNIMSDNTLRSDFKIQYIRTNVQDILNRIKGMEKKGINNAFDFELEIMTKLPDFYSEYPFLVKKICKKEDLSYLYKMFDNLEQVQHDDKSLSSVELKLGNELAEKYITKNK